MNDNVLLPVGDKNFAPLISHDKKILNETNERINCLHPVIILNPLVKDLIATHRNYTYMGKHFDISGARLYPHLKSFFGRKPNIDEIDQCYITDYTTGEQFSMYLLCPCGHCTICKSQKVESFAHRCLLETQVYPYAPWFITLTFDDRHFHHDGVRVEDCQNFMKRFRSRLEYYGIDLKQRYVAVSEYGSHSHRAHYHFLIWNLPKWSQYKCKSIIKKCWRKGFVYVSQVSSEYIIKGTGHKLSNPTKCFEYVAKYICKDCYVPSGMNPTFVLTSRRHGGIGAPFIDAHSRYIRSQRRWKFSFVDKFTQTLRPLVFNRYVLNRLFPSKCQSIPLKFRKAIVFLCKYACKVPLGSAYMDRIRHVFSSHVSWPELHLNDWSYLVQRSSPPSWVACRSCPLIIRAFWKLALYVNEFRSFDFNTAEKLAVDRNYVISRLTQNKTVRNLLYHANIIERSRALASQRELL